MKRILERLLKGKVAYYLMTVVALGALLGASIKWHP